MIAIELPRHCSGPVEFIGHFDDVGAAELFGRSAKREFVCRFADHLADELVNRLRVRHFILRHVRERNVFLENRAEAGPIAVAVAEHEFVIGKREEQRCERLFEAI